ncbi:Fur family transcriptional regulator [Formosa algae]|uniref:Fur family ferric uptake transcriptional regulator n=1 Tax=Formosa algae TaxID=225843 RepID=A0A9X0YN17_9FLAO|nr:transcriptional repressor [Formosa algae]MBP1841644.1 Fur family ferric uptake transcriptional regulator [Formosa algae]MDQ0337155.1 Fur family ferric uptake transcriptional regulator [Formosa algae]OEI80628.1 transcriptional regulator [Formosa algae]
MGVLRKTKSVDIVLTAFNQDTTAISVIALVEQLHSEMNKTTVYRILNKLEDDGILHSFLGKNGHKWYAKCHNCSSSVHQDIHPHFQCINCGKVECLDINVQIPNIPNRKVEVSQILLQGKCEDCYNSQKPEHNVNAK